MKKFINIFKTFSLLAIVSFTASSCEDWLTVYPQDRVVEEEFWEDKNDLEGVRYAAYKQMCSTVDKFIIWGDIRSDNFNLNRREHQDQRGGRMRDIYDETIKGLPDSSMTIFDWGGVYKTINFCNKVLQHGEEVLEKDKQFTTSEWIQMEAEMVTLRAMNYFYLLRAFKDIPYSTKVVNKDTEVMSFGLTNQLEVLDSLIYQVENVKGRARNRFVRLADSKGQITNCAVYALLADMYLWRASLHEGRGILEDTVQTPKGVVPHSVRGDYQLAADYADMSLASLERQNQEERNSQYNPYVWKTENYGLPNCNMIVNDFDGVYQSIEPGLEAHEAIFRIGNSVESIFELSFNLAEDRRNTAVNSIYGYNNGTQFEISQEGIGAAYGGSISDYDSRMWMSAQSRIGTGNTNQAPSTASGYYCLKYTGDIEVKMSGQATSREIKSVLYAPRDNANWIIYRMTDVMLIKAEALACIGGSDNLKTARNICNAIHRRSYCNYNKAESVSNDLSSGTIGNATAMSDVVKMVLAERQIELLGEGKRWFDLVRFAERNSNSSKDAPDERESTEEQFIGNGQSGMALMADTYLKNAYSNYYTTLKNRFKNRYGLYCPIYYKEVEASMGKIQQNPVWNKSKYDQ